MASVKLLEAVSEKFCWRATYLGMAANRDGSIKVRINSNQVSLTFESARTVISLLWLRGHS